MSGVSRGNRAPVTDLSNTTVAQKLGNSTDMIVTALANERGVMIVLISLNTSNAAGNIAALVVDGAQVLSVRSATGESLHTFAEYICVPAGLSVELFTNGGGAQIHMSYQVM